MPALPVANADSPSEECRRGAFLLEGTFRRLIFARTWSRNPSLRAAIDTLTKSDTMSYTMVMETVARKERDLRRREDLFLDRAHKLLLKRGYHGLTMDRIAKATGYSRGTIYQHFGCKEDIIVTLISRALDRRLVMLELAPTFLGRPRERMQAVGEAAELFARVYPGEVRLFHIANTEAIMQKASDETRHAMKACLQQSIAVLAGIVRDAMAQGDLELNGRATPEEITFNLWAISDGGYTVAASWPPPSELGIPDPFATVMNGCEALCDGYGWRPLSTEWDYEDTRKRVRRELFPAEAAKVSAYRHELTQCQETGLVC